LRLFDTVSNAAAMMQQLNNCHEIDDPDYDVSVTVMRATNSGVSVFGTVGTFSGGPPVLSDSYAQYGNVVLYLHDPGDDISWEDWQAQAPAFEQAVDQAAQD